MADNKQDTNTTPIHQLRSISHRHQLENPRLEALAIAWFRMLLLLVVVGIDAIVALIALVAETRK